MRHKTSVTLLLVVLLAGGNATATKRPPPPSMAEMAGVWIGWTSDTLTFFRLDLHADGTGTLASSFLNRPATLSRVRSWRLSQFQLYVDTAPVDDNVDFMRLSGEFFVQRLDLKVAATNGSWRLRLTLHREVDVTASLAATTTRMQATAAVPVSTPSSHSPR